ncbi:MAG: LysM peptidoglycan-binding domain-containing protein [Halobacteriovoraceae bacterium]|nr:LysM peptidoglycan-binding domain-containing protein [Halobacteriovoraceae bacterium]
MAIIYEKVDLPKGRRARRNFLRKRKRLYRKILRSLAKKKQNELNSEERRVKKIIGQRSSNDYKAMARNLRFQYGLRDRYLAGLKRSYFYMDYIESVFDDLSMPEELKFLPHVESSFNYQAYSKVGAAGIWQFMRSTARHYRLKVNYVVDERRDVFKATKAAAKLLKTNYKILGTWPLALTAYNHGAASIKRAIRKLGTKEIDQIVSRYKGRRFGFASKNFYSTFMATVQISKEPKKYFPDFVPPLPLNLASFDLPKSMRIKSLIKVLDISPSKFKDLNPSIRRSAYRNGLFLPKKLKIYLPLNEKDQVPTYIANIKKYKVPKREFLEGSLHIVSRGESLFDISRMYKVNLNDVIAFNNIVNPSRIYAGMKIKIPGKDEKVKTIVAKIDPKPTPIAKKPVAVISKPAPTTLVAYGPSLNELKAEEQLSLTGYDLDINRKSPNRYQVRIETEETLGHFAEWANVRTQSIRNANRLSYSSLIYSGQKLIIPLSDKELVRFKQERNSYHLSLQEDFYENYNVTGTSNYKVKKGDTLTEILEKFNIPFWLLRKTQKDQVLKGNLFVGQNILIPEIESAKEPSGLILSDENAE